MDVNELGSTGLELHSALVVGKALFDFDGQADNELTFKVLASSSVCLSDSVPCVCVWVFTFRVPCTVCICPPPVVCVFVCVCVNRSMFCCCCFVCVCV